MRYYNKILYWENRNRVKELNDFLELLGEYLLANDEMNRKNVSDKNKSDWMSSRQKVNKKLYHVRDIVKFSSVNYIITYTPPPMIGGYVQSIDIFLNINNLDRYNIQPITIFDTINRAIGVYEEDKRKSFVRTLNPFFYAGELLNQMAELPIVIFGKFGGNTVKAKGSILGKIAKGTTWLFSLVGCIWAILKIAELLGYLDKIKYLLGISP